MRRTVLPLCSWTVAIVVPLALALASMSTACESPTALSPRAGLEILGPESVAPGESRQFTALVEQANGAKVSVTEMTVWSIEDPQIATLPASSPGVVSGLAAGETLLRGQYNFMESSKKILVLPNGTFRMRGFVTDHGRPVARVARIEVASGPLAGLSAIANPFENGFYALYGVPPEVEIRVSADGYVSLVRRVMLTNNDDLVDFALEPDFDRPDYSGVYTLMIIADPACADALPEMLRSRTYSADLRQAGPEIDVTLGGAGFIGARNRFSGSVFPENIVADLHPYESGYYYDFGPDPSVMERLDAGSVYSPSGHAVLTPVPTGLSGTLDGSITLLAGNLPRILATVADCRSDAHQFILTR